MKDPPDGPGSRWVCALMAAPRCAAGLRRLYDGPCGCVAPLETVCDG
jgi:hypothetical protein